MNFICNLCQLSRLGFQVKLKCVSNINPIQTGGGGGGGGAESARADFERL